MKHNLLVWTAHSCRRDVFLEELERGNLEHYGSLVERGLFFPSAVVGGHFQRTSNLSEITGRPFTSPVHARENILNAAERSGAVVGVVQDFVITKGAQDLQRRGLIDSVDEVYPRLIERPELQNLGYPKLEFLPDVSPSRWLYWYRERATHRHFYNFALGFEEDGGLFEVVVNENPAFVRDQQRYSLRLQDQWLGSTLQALDDVLDDTVLLVFSSHGTSLEGWLPLMRRVTRATVDHSGLNFHPQVSHSFAILSGPGIEPGERKEWISIMDLKPTLCRLLGLRGPRGFGVRHRPARPAAARGARARRRQRRVGLLPVRHRDEVAVHDGPTGRGYEGSASPRRVADVPGPRTRVPAGRGPGMRDSPHGGVPGEPCGRARRGRGDAARARGESPAVGSPRLRRARVQPPA